MQTVNYSDYIYYAGTTQPVVRVPVYVYEANTENLASLYDGSGAAIDNPTKTDDNGLFDFWTTFGKYDIYVHNTKEYSVSLLNLAYFYLGIYDANPTERPDGSALQDGDMYFNSVINHTKLYNNGLWYYADDMMNASGVAYDPASGPQTDVQTQMRDYDAHLSDIDDQFDTLYSESGSDEIGFIQDGVDAVATTVQTKLSETISVKDFGAVGDGVTDDTAAMQAAVDYVSTTGQAVYFPAGEYVGSIDVQSGYVDVRLFGENRETTIIEAKNNSTATISVHWTAFRCQIENLSVKNTSGGNNGTHYGIHSLGSGSNNGATGLKLSNVLVDGYNINVKLDEFNDQYIENCVFSGAVAGGNPQPAGANLYAGSPTFPCVGLTVDQLYTIGGEFGMYLENTEGIKLTHLDCVLSTRQGLIHQRTSGNTIGMIISDSYFDSTGTDALFIEGVDSGMFSDIWVSASTVGGTGWGVQLANCSFNAFNNVQVYGCRAGGILLLQDCSQNTFSGCISRDNLGDGVKIADSNNPFNIFNNCVSFNNSGTDVVFLDTTPQSPNYWLNSFRGTQNIQLKDTAAGGNASGGTTFSLTFQRQNLNDGAASGNLDFTTGQTAFYSPFNGVLISHSIALNDTRVAGTLYARPTINGAADDDLRVEINGVNTQYNYLNIYPGGVPVSAGDLIRVFYDSDASWDTTGGAGTVDISATLVFVTT